MDAAVLMFTTGTLLNGPLVPTNLLSVLSDRAGGTGKTAFQKYVRGQRELLTLCPHVQKIENANE
jgi:hypothetical protein